VHENVIYGLSAQPWCRMNIRQHKQLACIFDTQRINQLAFAVRLNSYAPRAPVVCTHLQILQRVLVGSNKQIGRELLQAALASAGVDEPEHFSYDVSVEISDFHLTLKMVSNTRELVRAHTPSSSRRYRRD
jgi:hypothetical protein